MVQMHLLVNLDSTEYKWSILSHFGVTLLVNHTCHNRVILIRFVQTAGGHLCSHIIISVVENNDSFQPKFVKRSRFWFLQLWSIPVLCVLYSSVSQPPDRDPVPGPGINYTGPREAWGIYNMLQDFISQVDNLNVILYFSTYLTIYISVLILFMIMP